MFNVVVADGGMLLSMLLLLNCKLVVLYSY